MFTIEELESACDATQPVRLPRHEIEAPELSQQATFYPFGFPVKVRTNFYRVLEQLQAIWGAFERQHDTEPMRCDIQLVRSDAIECPPEPTYRIMLPLLMCVADANNYSVVDLERCHTSIVISDAALRYPLYAQYFLLGAPVCCVTTRYTTPVHAGCVALDGRGVLLCGDSGAGKSTLSYACARSGWSYRERRWKLPAERRNRPDRDRQLSSGALPANSCSAIPRNCRPGDYSARGWQALDRAADRVNDTHKSLCRQRASISSSF